MRADVVRTTGIDVSASPPARVEPAPARVEPAKIAQKIICAGRRHRGGYSGSHPSPFQLQVIRVVHRHGTSYFSICVRVLRAESTNVIGVEVTDTP
jgi:hypothetical protein